MKNQWQITLKSQKGEYYIEGLIATQTVDRVDDKFSYKGLMSVVEECKNKNVTIDLEHEVFRDPETKKTYSRGRDLVAVGVVEDAWITEIKKNKYGVMAKVKLNKKLKRFKDILYFLENKFVNAFSIAFNAIQFSRKYIKGSSIRLLNKIRLLNIALTSMPVNPDAIITEVIRKSLNSMMEENTMVKKSCTECGHPTELKAEGEEKKDESKNPNINVAVNVGSDAKNLAKESKKVVEETKDAVKETKENLAEAKEKVEEVASDEAANKAQENSGETSEKVEVKSLVAEFKSVLTEFKSIKDSVIELNKEVKAFKETPIMKAMGNDDGVALKSENDKVKSTILSTI